jgi:hypothetical protein
LCPKSKNTPKKRVPFPRYKHGTNFTMYWEGMVLSVITLLQRKGTFRFGV